MIKNIAMALALFSIVTSVNSYAQLQALQEDELTEITGEGVSIVFEDYNFDASNGALGGDLEFKLTGIEDGNGDPVDIELSRFFISGPDSNYGESNEFIEGNYVNLGRLTHPYTIDMLDGNDLAVDNDILVGSDNGWYQKAVLQVAAPELLAPEVDGNGDPILINRLDENGAEVEIVNDKVVNGKTTGEADDSIITYAKTQYNVNGYDCSVVNSLPGSGLCSSRPKGAVSGYNGERMDIGLRFDLNFLSPSLVDSNVNLFAQNVSFDGSYLRLWGEEGIDIDGQGALDNTLAMEIQFNMYASSMRLNSCDATGTTCGSDINTGAVSIELALGDAEYGQPLTFDVKSDGNFILEVQHMRVPDSNAAQWITGSDGSKAQAPDQGLWEYYEDYYENGRKSSFRVEDVVIGDPSNGGYDFGNSYITNLQIHYLKVTSHDI
jgi:hypothetical protein